MKYFCSVVLAVFVSVYSLAQITVDNSVTPEDAMQTLLGENVTISNLQFTGFNEQIGTFECVECGLDFDSGVIMATGDVNTALGPNNSGFNSIGGMFQATSDPDLDLLNPGFDFHDLAVLEFDFVALGDSVFFRYVFASDEYPEYSGGSFNDTFGFFMSGPGINGDYSNNSENLALIPGTDTGVTINNVNNGTDGTSGPCMNCEYYENNGTGAMGEPQFDDETVVGYDGYTVGLTAVKGGLVCGETYHLRLVIADAGDNGFDSAVILEAGSLSSNLTVGVELQVQATTEDGVMNEECGLAELIFTRPEAISSDLPFTVNIAYSGDAINGVDYTEIPEVVQFDPGVDEIIFILDAFEDGITEGPEQVIMDMQSVAVCQGESVPSSFEFTIVESVNPVVEGYDVEICDGTSIEIAPIITGGSGGFLFEWNTSETTESITVSPDMLTTYTVTLSDTCLATIDNADINVGIAVYPPLELTTNPTSIDIDCNWFGENLTMSASGGDGDYTYEWLNEDGNTLSYGSEYYIWDSSIQSITAQVTDGCTFVTQTELIVNNSVTPLEVDVPEEINVCPGEFTIDAEITGEPPYVIDWYNNSNFDYLGNGESLTYNTDTDMQIALYVSDNCFQFSNHIIDVNILAPEPLVISAGPDLEGACEEEISINSIITSGVEPFSFEWETEDGDNLGANEGTTFNLTETEVVVLTVSDACNQVETDSVNVELVMVPLELEVPEILTGNCLEVFEVEASANYDDNLILTWNGPDGMSIIDDNLVYYQSLESGVIELQGDAGCGNVASVQTEIYIISEPIQLELVADTAICFEGNAFLGVSATGGTGDLSYVWTGNGDVLNGSNVTVSPSFTEVYYLDVEDQCENTADGSVEVEVQHIAVQFDVTALGDDEFQFIPVLTPECYDCTYLWQFSDGFESDQISPTHQFEESGYIGATLVVTTNAGCETLYTDQVNVPAIVYIPNSFTPDNDGINDVWKVEIRGIDQYEMTVFNRWGEIVFYSKDPTEGWVGGNMGGDYYVPNGVYSYTLKYRALDSQAYTKRGSVSVLR